MRKSLNLFVKEASTIIVFMLIPHLIYGIQELYGYILQYFNKRERI